MNTKLFKNIVLLGVIFSSIAAIFAIVEVDWSEIAAWFSAIAWSVLFYTELKSKSK